MRQPPRARVRAVSGVKTKDAAMRVHACSRVHRIMRGALSKRCAIDTGTNHVRTLWLIVRFGDMVEGMKVSYLR
jgi:hypothetical protein